MKKYLFLALLPLAIACEKAENLPGEIQDPGTLGTWVLTEQLISPGGPAVFEPVTSGKTLEFFADGSMTSNGDLCTMNTESNSSTTGTYNTQTKLLFPDNCSSLSFQLRARMQDGDLIVEYPCIEPCWQKYKRVVN